MKTFQKKRTHIEVFFLILKGIMMGAANKVPGGANRKFEVIINNK